MKYRPMKIQTPTLSKRRHSLAGKTNLILSALALAFLASAGSARGADDQNAPELPSPVCDTVNVPEGHRVSSQVYALGVQIYRWTGTNWAFVGPEAVLF